MISEFPRWRTELIRRIAEYKERRESAGGESVVANERDKPSSSVARSEWLRGLGAATNLEMAWAMRPLFYKKMGNSVASKPIIGFDISTEEYFQDKLCPVPTLSQSLAKIIIAKSPGHARLESPRLNPNFVADDEKRFDIGSIAHSLLIGRGKSVEILDFPDWRTKASKEAREACRVAGKLGILRRDYDKCLPMVEAAKEQMAAVEIGSGRNLLLEWMEANGEVVIAWLDQGVGGASPVWCRTMIDKLSVDYSLVFDYKTTAMSAAPSAIPGYMTNQGWDIQAAFHAMACNAIDTDGAGRRKHLFICQEVAPPYALTVSQLDEATLTMGHKMALLAMEKWAACMASDRWPLYPLKINRPAYPDYKISQWEERELNEALNESI